MDILRILKIAAYLRGGRWKWFKAHIPRDAIKKIRAGESIQITYYHGNKEFPILFTNVGPSYKGKPLDPLLATQEYAEIPKELHKEIEQTYRRLRERAGVIREIRTITPESSKTIKPTQKPKTLKPNPKPRKATPQTVKATTIGTKIKKLPAKQITQGVAAPVKTTSKSVSKELSKGIGKTVRRSWFRAHGPAMLLGAGLGLLLSKILGD